MVSYPIIPKFENIICGVINNAIYEHRRVTIFRFDLRFPFDALQLQHDKYRISNFIDSLKTKITYDVRRKNKQWKRNLFCSVNYVWVREVGSVNNNVHYHVLLALPKDIYHSFGNYKALDKANLSTMIQESWASAMNLNHPDFMKQVYFGDVIYIDHKQDLSHAINTNSTLRNNIIYLAKEETKISVIGNRIGYSQF